MGAYNDLDEANNKIEQLTEKVARLDMNLEFLLTMLRAGEKQAVSNNLNILIIFLDDLNTLPNFALHQLPSYLEINHPLHSVPNPMAIFDTSQRLLVDCNTAFSTLLGYDSPSELIISSLVTLPGTLFPFIS